MPCDGVARRAVPARAARSIRPESRAFGGSNDLRRRPGTDDRLGRGAAASAVGTRQPARRQPDVVTRALSEACPLEGASPEACPARGQRIRSGAAHSSGGVARQRRARSTLAANSTRRCHPRTPRGVAGRPSSALARQEPQRSEAHTPAAARLRPCQANDPSSPRSRFPFAISPCGRRYRKRSHYTLTAV